MRHNRSTYPGRWIDAVCLVAARPVKDLSAVVSAWGAYAGTVYISAAPHDRETQHAYACVRKSRIHTDPALHFRIWGHASSDGLSLTDLAGAHQSLHREAISQMTTPSGVVMVTEANVVPVPAVFDGFALAHKSIPATLKWRCASMTASKRMPAVPFAWMTRGVKDVSYAAHRGGFDLRGSISRDDIIVRDLSSESQMTGEPGQATHWHDLSKGALRVPVTEREDELASSHQRHQAPKGVPHDVYRWKSAQDIARSLASVEDHSDYLVTDHLMDDAHAQRSPGVTGLLVLSTDAPFLLEVVLSVLPALDELIIVDSTGQGAHLVGSPHIPIPQQRKLAWCDYAPQIVPNELLEYLGDSVSEVNTLHNALNWGLQSASRQVVVSVDPDSVWWTQGITGLLKRCLEGKTREVVRVPSIELACERPMPQVDFRYRLMPMDMSQEMHVFVPRRQTRYVADGHTVTLMGHEDEEFISPPLRWCLSGCRADRGVGALHALAAEDQITAQRHFESRFASQMSVTGRAASSVRRAARRRRLATNARGFMRGYAHDHSSAIESASYAFDGMRLVSKTARKMLSPPDHIAQAITRHWLEAHRDDVIPAPLA